MTSLPKIAIQNLGAAQTMVPFTFGQVFAPGHFKVGEGLEAGGVPLQIDTKATHADGSIRHAVISGVLPKLAAGEVVNLQMSKSAGLASSMPGTFPESLSASVALKIGTEIYEAGLPVAINMSDMWLKGAITGEIFVPVQLRTTAGVVHPRLSARFGIRWYPGTNRARVEFVIENTKAFTTASNETYDAVLKVNDQMVYERKAVIHYRHARCRITGWVGGNPSLIVHPDTAYLIATKAVSNYDQTIVPTESVLADWASKLTPENTGPMGIGPVTPYMPMTGGRPDIGPLPQWTVLYLLSHDKRAFDTMIAAANGAASWSVHYRDENTGHPIRVDSEANKNVSFHMNLNYKGPLPVPRVVNDNWDLARTPYDADTAHQPSLVYVPYLVTGEYYYLEELQFWAAWNPLGTDPGFSGQGKGLVRWQQIRGQAWSMRTMGHAAYITPDAHPLKPYFVAMLDNNLAYYHTTFVTANPNVFGVYDATGEGMSAIDGYSPWQDDFFTWSFGYLNELGFTKALPILQWKAKWPVGRMTASGFCWTMATSYYFNYSDGQGAPRYTSFPDLYKGNFAKGARGDGGELLIHPEGLNFLDQACGSEQQADWFRKAGRPWWNKGQMVGYADSIEGYPANMQPALAVVAASGVENGAKAWQVFDGRAVKPDYRKGPQWAIVPRSAEAVQPPVVDPAPTPAPTPVPTPVPAPKVLKITTPSSTKLAKLKGLTVEVFNPVTLKPVKTFTGIAASTKGVVIMSDTELVKSIQYAATVKNSAGVVVLVFYPLVAA